MAAPLCVRAASSTRGSAHAPLPQFKKTFKNSSQTESDWHTLRAEMANGLTVVLRRGDLARARACAIVTSANDALSGNANPNYWRFAQRVNADGRVRALGGPALAAACEALPLLPSDTAPRDIQRWESTAKRGVSARVRCRVGACLLYTSPSPRDATLSRMPSSA